MVHTHQNGSGADQTHDDTGKDGRDTEQHIQHPCQTFTDIDARRADDSQSKKAGNEQGDGRGDNGAGGFGNDIINKKALGHPMVYNSLTEVPYEELRSRTLYLKQVEPTVELRRVFNLEAGETLWEFRRIRIVRYEISQVETGWMPCALFPELNREVLEDSIQSYALRQKYRIAYFITNYHAAALDAEHAELLHCKKGLPVMDITSRGVLRDGRIFVYSRIKAVQYECTYVSPFNKDVFLSRRKIITEDA